MDIYRTLIVYLTTWDIKGKPTLLDIDIAAYLDKLYENYQRKFTKDDAMKLPQASVAAANQPRGPRRRT